MTRPETPPVPAAVLFDLDDTLYPERAFVDGGFQAVGQLLAGPSGRSAAWLVERLWALHDRDGRGRLFDALIAELGLDDVDGALAAACVLVYRTHVVRLEPVPRRDRAARRPAPPRRADRRRVRRLRRRPGAQARRTGRDRRRGSTWSS